MRVFYLRDPPDPRDRPIVQKKSKPTGEGEEGEGGREVVQEQPGSC